MYDYFENVFHPGKRATSILRWGEGDGGLIITGRWISLLWISSNENWENGEMHLYTESIISQNYCKVSQKRSHATLFLSTILISARVQPRSHESFDQSFELSLFSVRLMMQQMCRRPKLARVKTKFLTLLQRVQQCSLNFHKQNET